MTSRRRALALLGLGGLALAACAHSGPTRLYTMAPRPAPAGVPLSRPPPPLRILGVRLPAAFDQLEVIRPVAGGRLAYSDFDRWAAAPGRLAEEALSRDLQQRLPGLMLDPSPSVGPPSLRAMRVTMLSLESGPDGVQASVVVEIHAAAGDPAGGLWPMTLSAPAQPESPELQVELWSRLIADLADRTAEILRRSPQG